MAQQYPRFPLPPPLMMWSENSFSHLTLTQRLPAIVRRVIAENNFPPYIVDNLEKLIKELPQGIVRQLQQDQGPDLVRWKKYLAPFVGKRWLDIPWFFAEAYFFRRILEATHYFLPGISQNLDPFALQKRRGLEKARDSIQVMSAKVNASIASQLHNSKRNSCQKLIPLLYLALWGNQADLSLWPVDASTPNYNQETYSKEADVLLNDTSILADKIASFGGIRIDLILDNAGFELVCDLGLADFLLASKAAVMVYLHLKSHPTFVSDATIQDVQQTIDVLANDPDVEVQSLGHRLQNYITSGRLRLREHLFWTSPLMFWEMPQLLRQELAQASLVLIKGDANYRRLLGDRQWSFTTAFEDIVCYFPAPFATLRTLKSEIIVGLQSGQAEVLNCADPQWLTNGKRGLIQFVEPS